MIKSVPVSKVEDFQKIIRNLNKKQEQYGMALTTAKEVGRHVEEIPFVIHEKGDRPEQDAVHVVKVLFVDYEVTNLGIVRNDEGYEYIGTRTKNKNGVIVVCPDRQYYDEVSKDTDICDHCGTVRNRKQYHIFRKTDGTVIRVGSTCCKEYFGIDASTALDIYVKTVTVWGDREQGSFDEETDVVYGWNDIYQHVKGFTKDFTEWGDQVIDYDVKPADEDFSEKITEIREYWNMEAGTAGFFVGRYRQNSFAPNCADIMGYDFVSRNRLKMAFAAIHFGMLKVMEVAERKANRELREKQENEWKASQEGVEQPKYRKGDKVEFEGTVVRNTADKGEDPKHCVVVNCSGVFYRFFAKGEAFARLTEGDHVKARGVFDWECTIDRYISQNVNKVRLEK